MKTKGTYAIIATLIMLSTCIASTISIDSETCGTSSESCENEKTGVSNWVENGYPLLSSAIVVICDEKDFKTNKEVFLKTSSTVDVLDSIPDSIDADIIVIDGGWYLNNSDVARNKIDGFVSSGITVISIGSSTVFTDSNLDCYAFGVDSDESDINMMSYDSATRTYYCYTSSYIPEPGTKYGTTNDVAKTDADYSDLLSERIKESVYKLENSQVRASSINTMDVEKSIKRIIDVTCGGHGTFSVNTEHFKLKESDPEYNYYLSEYHLTTVPNKGDLRGTADITIRSDNFSNGSRLFRFEPNTTNGVTTFSFSIMPGEFFLGFTYSRSYETPDVVVHNKCDPSKGLFEIWHDVNERENVGRDTYFVEPTKLVIVDSQKESGVYSGIDTYKVNFCNFLGFGSNIVILPVSFKWYEKQDMVQLQ